MSTDEDEFLINTNAIPKIILWDDRTCALFNLEDIKGFIIKPWN